MEKVIKEIEDSMAVLLTNIQREELHKVLVKVFEKENLIDEGSIEVKELDYCNVFVCVKQVEGCSAKSIKYYRSTIEKMLNVVNKPIKHIKTEDLREYLSNYYIRS